MKLARKIEERTNYSKSEADVHVHSLVPGIKSFSRYMGFAVSLIGVLVIFGWLLGIEKVNNVFAGLSGMEANTAIAFITAGLSLLLRGSTNPKMRTAVQILGAITGLIGLLTLGQYLSGRNFGIDELIFKDLAGSGALHPGRMSFMSALSFTMLGMALLLIDSNNERRYTLAQSLTLVAGMIAYIALVVHLFDVDSLFRVGVFAPMAFHTVLSFILLFVGIICAQPEDGWMGNLIADTLGGDLLRRLLPVAFVVPILFGWLRLQGQVAGYYETFLGTTLLVIAITLLLSVIIWFNAKGLTRADMDRRRVEQNLRESEQRYHTLFESIDEGFCIIEKVQGEAGGEPLDFRYVVANPAFAVQSGMSGVVGKTIRQAFPGEPEEWFLTYDTILRTGEPIRFERGLVTQGRVLELYAFRVEDETHRRVAVIFKDITERKQAEEKLRQSEERFRSIVNQTAGGIAEIDLTGTFLTVNERYLEITGYAREELVGRMQMSDITHQDDLPRNLELLKECLEHGTPFEIEKRYIGKDGSFVWVNNSVSAIKGADGKPHSFVAIVIDITKRKLAEEWEQSSAANLLAAAEANAKFRTFFDQGSYFAGVMALDGTIIEANRLSLEAGGYARDEVIGRKFWDCGWWNPSPALMEMVRNGTQYAAEGNLFRQESTYFLADGSERYVDLIIAPVKDETGRLLFLAPTGTDITERKRTEQALTEFAQQQEALYKLTDQLQRTNSLEDVFNAALDAILGALHCDRASILLFDDADVMRFVAWRGLSDHYRKTTDGHSPWTPDEKNAQPICINDISTGEVSDSLKDVIQAEGIGSLAFIPLLSDGRLIGKFMTYYNAPHVFSDAELDLSLTIANQLAFGIERKRAEGSLRESKELYRGLFDLVPVGVYTCDAEGLIQEFNHRAVELWGREPLKNDPREKFCGSFKIYYPDGRFMPHDTCPMARILGGETLEPHELEVLVERPDGTRHNIIAHPLPLKDESGKITGAINSFYDITARKQAEEALHQLNLQLESQVQSRTAKLRSVNQSLREEIAERKRVEEQLIYQALLISNVNDAIIATDENLVVTYWNPTAEQIYGWSAEEVMGRTVSDILQTEFVDGNTYSGSLQKVNELRELRTAVTHLRKDGSRIFVEAHTSTLLNEDGELTGYVSINRDITERKKAEQELRLNRDRLRSLSQRLVEVQEEERRTIANELHDRVGQSLSALNINLTIMKDQLSADAVQRIGSRLNDSMQLAAEAITLVRDVMSDLRPSVLDDYGLEAALQSYMDQFKSRYGIKVLFEKPDQPILRMGASIEMTFLRIAQESLLNIARHARADQVNLSLGQEGNAVRLIIQDNGNGIASWQEANRPGSHGLTIMRERADAVGGNLKVVSVPGKGTKVEVSIPIENGAHQTVQEEERE